MINIQLEEMKDALKLVTKGPWKSFIEGRDHLSGSSFIRTGDENYDIEFINLRSDDQDFIAISRNMMPLLVNEIVRLQQILSNNQLEF